MQAPVHPVHAELDREHVQREVQQVGWDPDIVDPWVRHGPTLLSCHLDHGGQDGIDRHRQVGDLQAGV